MGSTLNQDVFCRPIGADDVTPANLRVATPSGFVSGMVARHAIVCDQTRTNAALHSNTKISLNRSIRIAEKLRRLKESTSPTPLDGLLKKLGFKTQRAKLTDQISSEKLVIDRLKVVEKHTKDQTKSYDISLLGLASVLKPLIFNANAEPLEQIKTFIRAATQLSGRAYNYDSVAKLSELELKSLSIKLAAGIKTQQVQVLSSVIPTNAPDTLFQVHSIIETQQLLDTAILNRINQLKNGSDIVLFAREIESADHAPPSHVAHHFLQQTIAENFRDVPHRVLLAMFSGDQVAVSNLYYAGVQETCRKNAHALDGVDQAVITSAIGRSIMVINAEGSREPNAVTAILSTAQVQERYKAEDLLPCLVNSFLQSRALPAVEFMGLSRIAEHMLLEYVATQAANAPEAIISLLSDKSGLGFRAETLVEKLKPFVNTAARRQA